MPWSETVLVIIFAANLGLLLFTILRANAVSRTLLRHLGKTINAEISTGKARYIEIADLFGKTCRIRLSGYLEIEFFSSPGFSYCVSARHSSLAMKLGNLHPSRMMWPSIYLGNLNKIWVKMNDFEKADHFFQDDKKIAAIRRLLHYGFIRVETDGKKTVARLTLWRAVDLSKEQIELYLGLVNEAAA